MQNERLLESFIEHAPAVIAMFDRDMRYLAASARWKTAYHLDSDPVGRSHYEVFPEISQEWKDIHRRGLAGEVLAAEKDKFPRLDGSVQWLKWEVRPWYGAGEDIGGIVIFSEDITEQVNAYEALKASEERFRIIADMTHDLIFDCDLGSGKVWWNEGHLAAFGLGPDALGKGLAAWMDCIDPADRQRVSDAVRSFIQGDAVDWSNEYRVAQVNGATAMVIDNRSVMRDADGKATRMFGCIVDVTKHKLADERMRLVVEACPSGIITTNIDGNIVLVNAEAERLFGYRREELIGRPVDILVPERLRGQHALHRDGFTRHPETRGMGAGRDVFGLRKDATEFPAEIGLNPVRTSEGLLVLNMIVDISERQRLDRVKDEFIATVSHELRTPLTSISGSLGLLVGGAAGPLPGPVAHWLTIAYTNCQRLGRLVNDILDMEKMESGKAVFEFKRVEVGALVAQTIEANRGFAEDCGVRLRLDAASAACDVRVDADRLMQAATNLISNAIKFSPPGEEVIVAVKPRGDTVRISVRDHGHGIPEEFKPHVFEKFAQADATDARAKSGTGLGLSIVKEIVERLDGTVGFDDAPGGGAIFHIDLPNWARAVKLQSRLVRNARHRILLCEDQPEAAVVLVDRLGRDGFLTDVALTAEEALARVAATPYALILVDLQRPDGNGIELIRQLRAQPQIYNTLLVVLSADLDAASDKQQPATILNIVEWLDAPIDITRLVRVFDQPGAGDSKTPKRVLHIESDPELLRTVAQALGAKAEVMSVDSIDAARRALAAHRFDVAVLDIVLAAGSGFELLHELRDGEGDAIPLIVFSPPDANPALAAQVRSALIKSRTSIDDLIALLKKRLLGGSPPSSDKDAA
jgi:PAS domain S-box-containing protein